MDTAQITKHWSWPLKRLRRRQCGFSLLELLVVCAILTVLVAIAVPNLIASRRAAQEGVAKSKLANIGAVQTTFRTLLGKRRYASLSELQTTTANGTPVLTENDLTVTGWVFSDEGAATATSFGVKVVPGESNPSENSYVVFQDQVVRRCAAEGPWNPSCQAVNE